MKSSGTAWLIALLSGPLFGFLVGSSVMVDVSEASWRWRCVVWIVLGAALPLVLAIAHTRALGVIVVTLLVGGTTIPAIGHLASGVAVEESEVRDLTCAVRERHGTSCIEYTLLLANGDELTAEPRLVAGVKKKQEVRVTRLGEVALRVEAR